MSGMLCAHVAVLAVFDAIVWIISVKGFAGTSAPVDVHDAVHHDHGRDYRSVRVHGRYIRQNRRTCAAERRTTRRYRPPGATETAVR
jgi:hypothetical protein